jgi:hypothetical protein
MNDEELITMTAKDRQHPLDFISFEEQGKSVVVFIQFTLEVVFSIS